MLSVIDEMLIGLAWKLEEGAKWGLTRGLEGEYFGVSAVKTNHITHNRIHTDCLVPDGPLVAAPWFVCTCSKRVGFSCNLAQTFTAGFPPIRMPARVHGGQRFSESLTPFSIGKVSSDTHAHTLPLTDTSIKGTNEDKSKPTHHLPPGPYQPSLFN